MGIKSLMKLIDDKAPDARKNAAISNFMGRTIAIDASMELYQFMVAVRSSSSSFPGAQLMNEAGEVTSHLQGFLNRATRLLEAGIKPVYVFDGEPPQLKSDELKKRREAKKKAEAELKERQAEAADGVDDMEKTAAEKEAAVGEVEKAAKRTVRVTKKHNEDVQALLRLMGIPVVLAPCEAEAQAALLVKQKKAWAVATEDMDTLCFQTPVMLRKLTNTRGDPVLQLDYEKVLKGFGMTYDEFVDLCILCGCDYAKTIRGVGPITAFKLIKEHGSIEKVVEVVDRKKHPVPEEFLSPQKLEDIRTLFKKPKVDHDVPAPFACGKPDVEGLKRFLVEEHGFNPDRVKNATDRLVKVLKKGSQKRIDSFFKVSSTTTKFAKAPSKLDSKGRLKKLPKKKPAAAKKKKK